jgi:hypothetical protein
MNLYILFLQNFHNSIGALYCKIFDLDQKHLYFS